MAAMADEQTPRTSIANLILPPPNIPDNLISLSHLATAASMTPSTPTSRKTFNRTKSVPVIHSPVPPVEPQLPDDTRRNHRMSRTTSVAAPLRLAHAPTKRLSRRGSGLSSLARNAIASTTSGIVSGESSSEPPGTPHPPGIATGMPSPTPSPAVLRPINSNPIAGYQSKHTSASNSIESCVPATRSPIKSQAFHAAASRFQTGFAAGALASMRDDPMDCEDVEQREPSSSSHDAKLAIRPSRSRTTPDAKRAQNRESAKRFRVAQKKRWAELQETVEKKDEEIDRLKAMLQEVTNNTLARRPAKEGYSAPVQSASADALGHAELSLFVKLMISPPDDGKAGRAPRSENQIAPPLASNIGALYRVLVCKTDGSVLGVRHHTPRGREAMGGEVGSLVWEHVEPSNVPHLRFTVVHAANIAEFDGGEPQVFSYQRRERTQEQDGDKWIRMKGCVFLTRSENGEISGVLLAEFIEL